MRTRSGCRRSRTAVPSARNSGLDRIWKVMPGRELASRMMRMLSAVLHGTVDFSTTILGDVAISAIRRVADSTYLRSAARPAPMPLSLVGVLTDTKMMSARSIAPSTSVVKNSVLPRHSGGGREGDEGRVGGRAGD